MSGYILVDKSKDFAKSVIDAIYRNDDKNDYILTRFLRAGTGVGENMNMAQYLKGTDEFIIKLEAALRDIYDFEYWLDLAFESDLFLDEVYEKLKKESAELKEMLLASYNVLKQK